MKSVYTAGAGGAAAVKGMVANKMEDRAARIEEGHADDLARAIAPILRSSLMTGIEVPGGKQPPLTLDVPEEDVHRTLFRFIKDHIRKKKRCAATQKERDAHIMSLMQGSPVPVRV